jgi:hypothetical protein
MSTQLTTQLTKPDFGRLYGITFSPETKQPIVRTPRVLKVGIGVPKGRAISVFLFNGTWHIRHGVWEKNPGGKDKLVMKTVFRGGQNGQQNTKEAAEVWHNAHKNEAAVSNRPQKVPYFTFTRRTIVEGSDGKPVEVFEPDFDAIEAHGDLPKRLPVVLTSDNPLYQEDAYWSATELKCHGDGITAERAITMGSKENPGWEEAKKSGQKMFLFSPCRLGGCPFSGKECKRHSTINIQLAYALRIGATAYFSSTGDVTANMLFSSFTEIKVAAEKRDLSIVGIPMDLVLGSFRANHEGKPSVQPCVSLELRAAGMKRLNQILVENSWVPSKLGETQQVIAAPVSAEIYDASPETLAPGIAAEFTDAEFDDDVPAEEENRQSTGAATASAAKITEIGEKLKSATATAPEKEKSPWRSRPEMVAAIMTEKERLGFELWGKILSAAGVTPAELGTGKETDPKFAAAYREMKAAEKPKATGVVAEGSPF